MRDMASWALNVADFPRLVHILAAGVFFSGFVKDLLCLPRPLSPPLQRITMSGSASLEYGFPSTHSTNAVSVAVYGLLILQYDPLDISDTASVLLKITCILYAFSIILGRVYCGMHGFLDVGIGTLLGAVLSIIQFAYGGVFDDYIHAGTVKNLVITNLIICVLIRIHPEPADDCPCFDDSVAFAGVLLGLEYGNWHFAKGPYALSSPVPATVAFNIESIGWPLALVRIVAGVVLIVTWREIMKPFLLRFLPPIFRVVEGLGLDLPRKYFKQASEYTKIPKHHKDDNVIPSVSEIPGLLRRRRAVSIGPQSEADAYETLAYREHRRRSSVSTAWAGLPNLSSIDGSPASDIVAVGSPALEKSQWETFESMMGTGIGNPAQADQEMEEKEMFSRLQKPRVRYDVEVITKLIVYSGKLTLCFLLSLAWSSSLVPCWSMPLPNQFLQSSLQALDSLASRMALH